MKYSEKVKGQLKDKGVKKTWLADALGLRYPDFWKKMSENAFSKDEKDKILALLGEDSPAKTEILKAKNFKKSLKQVLKSLG